MRNTPVWACFLCSPSLRHVEHAHMGMFYMSCVISTSPPAPPSLEHRKRAASGSFLVFGILPLHHHLPSRFPFPSNTKNAPETARLCVPWFPFLAHTLLSPLSSPLSPSLSLSSLSHPLFTLSKAGHESGSLAGTHK